MKSRPIMADEAQAIEVWLQKPEKEVLCPWETLQTLESDWRALERHRCNELFPSRTRWSPCPCLQFKLPYVRRRAKEFLRRFAQAQKSGGAS